MIDSGYNTIVYKLMDKQKYLDNMSLNKQIFTSSDSLDINPPVNSQVYKQNKKINQIFIQNSKPADNNGLNNKTPVMSPLNDTHNSQNNNHNSRSGQHSSKILEFYQYVLVNVNKSINGQIKKEIKEIFDHKMEVKECIQNLYKIFDRIFDKFKSQNGQIYEQKNKLEEILKENKKLHELQIQ